MFTRFMPLLAGPLLLAALAAPALAQPPNQWAPPPIIPQPLPTTQGTSNVIAAPGYQPVPVINPGGYAPVYPPGYYPTNPYGGYLSGKADVINARANAGIAQQQAQLLNQQVGMQSIQYRKALIDEANYERSITPNSEDIRIQKQVDAINRARHNPPQHEIWSGDSLNALVMNLQNAQRYDVRGPEVSLSPEIVKHINLTAGKSSAGLGMLKDGAKFRWPSALSIPAFDDDRKQIEDNTARALTQARRGPVDLQLVSALRDQVSDLGDKLRQQVQNVPANQYIEGKKFLGELNASLGTLKDPNVSNYFGGQWMAQAGTVHELVKEMTKQGLRFAPANSGDEPYYSALYQALVKYDVQMTQTASR